MLPNEYGVPRSANAVACRVVENMAADEKQAAEEKVVERRVVMMVFV